MEIFPMKEMARDPKGGRLLSTGLLILRKKFITSFGMVEVAQLFLYLLLGSGHK
jgi:hypothetical protein